MVDPVILQLRSVQIISVSLEFAKTSVLMVVPVSKLSSQSTEYPLLINDNTIKSFGFGVLEKLIRNIIFYSGEKIDE
jgi:hypothetical protein